MIMIIMIKESEKIDSNSNLAREQKTVENAGDGDINRNTSTWNGL